MKLYSQSIAVKTRQREDIINITAQIDEVLKRSDITTGMINVFTKHTTTGIFINEAESGVLLDIMERLETIVPKDSDYMHNRIDNNADAHIKSSIISPSVNIPVVDGKLNLGTWQSVFLVEFDGPRTRTVVITVWGQ
ncbi:MAG: secondary thiamine-phosphate synthase enzyme YjbQ [Candidatus Odinarchaeia archaeon]